MPEYDRSLIYLPDSLPQDENPMPESVVDRCWLSAAVYYGWTAPSAAFRLPDAFVSEGLTPQARAGFGFALGTWFSDEQKYGLELGGLYLSQGVARTGPNPIVRPAGPELANSELRVQYLTATADVRRRFVKEDRLTLDLLLGYRYARLVEEATVDGSRNALAVGRAHTNFNGRSVGFAGAYKYEEWTLNLAGTVALGLSSGHWAANGENFDKLRFAVLPAVAVRLDHSISEHSRAFVGYDFHYLSRAARAADDLPVVNGPMAVQPRHGEFWFQALNAGVELRF